MLECLLFDEEILPHALQKFSKKKDSTNIFNPPTYGSFYSHVRMDFLDIPIRNPPFKKETQGYLLYLTELSLYLNLLFLSK